MDRPLVSVVMATHNYGRFIGEAIESILAQTYRRFELIIVDDASTDSTLEVIGQYDDERIVLVKREECSCSGAAPRNDGLAVSRGDLIAVADADDISVPDRLERQVTFLEQNPSVDLLGGATIPVDEKGRRIGGPILKPVYDQPGEYRQALLWGEHVLSHPTLMFRRRILKKVSGYNDYVSSGDTEFVLRASRYFNLYNLKDVLCHHRQHSASVTRTCGVWLKQYHHAIFMFREYMWVQKEIERLNRAQGTSKRRRQVHPPAKGQGVQGLPKG
jgi:glycosyltransferase involved in cell wall biosynthesis